MLPLSLTAGQLGDLTGSDAPASLEEQVARFYEETREDVYRYLLTLGLYPPEAQEAAQEVFLRYYATVKRGESIQSPRGWVFRVAHNYGLKVRARQQQHAAPFDPDLEARIKSSDPGPEQSLADRNRAQRLHRALESLSEQQRRCLFLRMEGLRYPEIGAALGIGASTVGEFLRRAISRLKKEHHE
ncbi:MAG: sigma-70 family RNA polymerase sigma factor [Bryobacterales bacterium]|nr:sigma-70 family RNA polymerase sigma factor [Bryobacterales bacterium]